MLKQELAETDAGKGASKAAKKAAMLASVPPVRGVCMSACIHRARLEELSSLGFTSKCVASNCVNRMGFPPHPLQVESSPDFTNLSTSLTPDALAAAATSLAFLHDRTDSLRQVSGVM